MKLRTFKSSDADYERWCEAALRENLSFSAWARRCLNEAAALAAALERSHDGSGWDSEVELAKKRWPRA